jgi:two-component system OmpR family response regulator
VIRLASVGSDSGDFDRDFTDPIQRGSAESSFTHPLRVLIADDYADSAESLAVVLSIAGMVTEIAMDGEHALARANHWRPQICVLDIQMPKLDGCEIARRLRGQVWIERPLLIAVTGRTSAHHRRTALEAGFDHYMLKPASPVQLVRIIETYAEVQRSRPRV